MSLRGFCSNKHLSQPCLAPSRCTSSILSSARGAGDGLRGQEWESQHGNHGEADGQCWVFSAVHPQDVVLSEGQVTLLSHAEMGRGGSRAAE